LASPPAAGSPPASRDSSHIQRTTAPNSTTTDYLLKVLKKIFVGVSDTVNLRATVTVIRADGTQESVTSTD